MPGTIGKYLYYFKTHLEGFIWIAALIILAISNPHEEHYSLCVFHNLGFSFCPGCGIGHSISHFFHGNLETSFRSHPMGIPAIIILTYRIIQIFFIYPQNQTLKT